MLQVNLQDLSIMLTSMLPHTESAETALKYPVSLKVISLGQWISHDGLGRNLSLESQQIIFQLSICRFGTIRIR